MTWFKVDDGLWGHPKWLATPAPARALWVTAGSWSADNLTDGVIPQHVLPTLGGRRRDADALVAVGLWVEQSAGWAFHQWNETGRQPTREAVLAERDAAAERQRRGRENQRRKREGVTQVSRRDIDRDSRRDTAVSHGDSHGGPDPTRPKDVVTSGGQSPWVGATNRAEPRGTRVPDDFEPDHLMIAWARQHTPNIGRAEHEKFMDHWRAQPGAKGRKLDWRATWRNWMRRAQDEQRRRPAPRSTTTTQRVDAALELAAEYERQEQSEGLRAVEGGSQ